LYFDHADTFINYSVFTLPKVTGGTPQLISSNVVSYAAGGDGSVYLVHASNSVEWTVERWSSQTGATTVIGTTNVEVHGVVADARGAVWHAYDGTGVDRSTTIYAWSPGDTAPRTIYTETHQQDGTGVVAVNATHVFLWRNTWLDRIPRAGGGT